MATHTTAHAMKARRVGWSSVIVVALDRQRGPRRHPGRVGERDGAEAVDVAQRALAGVAGLTGDGEPWAVVAHANPPVSSVLIHRPMSPPSRVHVAPLSGPCLTISHLWPGSAAAMRSHSSPVR